MYLTATAYNFLHNSSIQNPTVLETYINNFTNNGVISHDLLYIPITVNVTLLSCPPGFTLIGDPPRCSCSSVLLNFNVECALDIGASYIAWSKLMWIGAKDYSIIIASSCPIDNCKMGRKHINLQDNPNAQCAFNHAGVLCGGCKENYSLAIGSSHCIHCPSNNNVALVIFFAAAGFLLVIFVWALNLTVTQGMINGLMFYANIVWAYQNAFFPQQPKGIMIFLKIFIAWLNLDFGIQTCFYNGLDMHGKTWLQFVFPFYTATIFLAGVHYSSKLSKICGNRSVPTLATLLFLSYAKLLRTIITILRLADLKVYPEGYVTKVWALDGNLTVSYTHLTLPTILRV